MTFKSLKGPSDQNIWGPLIYWKCKDYFVQLYVNLMIKWMIFLEKYKSTKVFPKKVENL